MDINDLLIRMEKNINNIKENNINNTNNIKEIKNNRLIKLDEFKKYLLKDKLKNKREIIKIENALSLFKNRFKIYKTIDTNYQFYTIFNKNDIIYQNRINEMLSYFTTNHHRYYINKMIINKEKDDIILKYLKENNKFKKVKKDKINLYRISLFTNEINKIFKNKKIKILDVGVGNGKKTKIIQKLTNSDIYGTDIKEWGPYNSIKKFSFPFKFIEENPYKIPYKNNIFDCITINLTLHHADDIMEVINECKRILKKEGIIVIIEHDVWNDYDNMIIDLQHRIYNYIFNENEVSKGDYYNYIEWDIIFNKCDMVNIYNERITDNITYSYKYDIQYFSIYKNK